MILDNLEVDSIDDAIEVVIFFGTVIAISLIFSSWVLQVLFGTVTKVRKARSMAAVGQSLQAYLGEIRGLGFCISFPNHITKMLPCFYL